MIAKGASRNNPRQLAVYLMRVERYDTGEPVELLELQSGWAASLDPDTARPRIASRLIEAFRDWQVLTEGTKQGRDGLYHAEISPEARYAETMTPEQWKRAADLLGEELGLQNQPRAVVLHGGTDGRKHLHVVWARTDVEAMKLVSDSYNFVAHEKASHRMELEFGQEFVPGKHAKRDREQQPEFPRQDFDYSEAQMAERSPLTVGERKEQIRALQAAAENGQAFKKGLEEGGYVLAQGERGYVVVDEAGVYSALTKNLQGVMKKAEVEAFMADVPLNQLPTVADARALQKEKALSAPQAEPNTVQQAKAAELTDAGRKKQITALRQQTDTAQAFKNALEESGYILARGDKRGYVLVDSQGDTFSLSRYVTDIKGKEYKAFMASLDAATLTDVDQAKALQAERALKAEKQGPEASKFLSPELAAKVDQAPPAPENQPRPIDLRAYAPKEAPSKFLPPEIAATIETPKQAEAPIPVAEEKPAEPQQPPAAEQPKKKLYNYRAYGPPAAPDQDPAPTQRRAALPSDPWMAQTGGVEQLSPAHLESAKTNYEKWAHKSRYEFADYVDYVQGQWKDKELPAPPSPAEARAETPGEAKPKKKEYDYRAYAPKLPPGLVDPGEPAPPQPELPDFAEGPKPTWIKSPEPRLPLTPKADVEYDAYAPKAPEPAAPKPADVRDLSLKEDFKGLPPSPPKPEPSIDPEIVALRQRIFKKQQAEYKKQIETNQAELREKEQAITAREESFRPSNLVKMEDFDARQHTALLAELERQAPPKGMRAAVKKFFNPEDEAQKAEKQEAFELFKAQQVHDRRAFIKSLQESRDHVLDALRVDLNKTRERQVAEMREREKTYDLELNRRLRERQKALDLAREEAQWAKDHAKEQEQRWDDPDVPRRGK